MRILKFEAVEKLQADSFPQGAVELDEDGQIVIYTGLYSDKKVPEPTQPGYVVGRTWKCEDSPHTFCEYQEDEDPAHDSCVPCGDPEERK
jgi:hypothetical protein